MEKVNAILSGLILLTLVIRLIIEKVVKRNKTVNIRYFNNHIPKIRQTSKGDWNDLRANTVEINNEKVKWNKTINEDEFVEYVNYKKGDILKIGTGVAMALPEGYEAYVAPRSSTFKNWGLMQTNSFGVIDNSYRGNDDEWMVQFKAMEDGVLERFDRVCQFRIQKNQPNLHFIEVDELTGDNRGGFGTSGKN